MPNNRKKRKRDQQVEAPRITVNVSREISSLEREIGNVFGSLLMITDETLEAHSTDGYKLYTTMLRKDARLAFSFRKRADNVLAQGYAILPPEDPTPEEEKRVAWFQEMFAGIKHFKESRRLFFLGIAYGFRPAEIIYERRADGTLGIRRFANREPDRFRFTPEGELRLCDFGTAMNEGEPMPEYKFLVNTWGADETPYGQGLLRELYPWWFFKNHTTKAFFRFVEKFGMPYIYATYPVQMPAPQQAELLETLVKMQSNSIGIGPEGTATQAQDPGRQSAVDVFRFAIAEYVDKLYTLAVLGQVLSTESESGTYALGKFQSKGEQRLVESDSIWQEDELNWLVRTIHNINFGAVPCDRYPRFSIPYEEAKDTKTVLEGVAIAVNDLGLKVSDAYVREVSGIPEPAEDEELLPGRKVAPSPFGGGFPGTEDEEPEDKGEPAAGLSDSTKAWLAESDRLLKLQQSRRKKKALTVATGE